MNINVSELFSLKGKTIIITGGAGHLGKGMSEALVAFGANLFILGHNRHKNELFAKYLREKYNTSKCTAIVYDMDNEESVTEAVDKVMEKTNRIDVLINNASYSCPKPLHEFEFDEWEKGLSGTINAVFRITKKILPLMIRKQAGNIINIGSMYGVVAPDMRVYGDSKQNNPANYEAGKAAIIQLTRYIACTYAKDGIRANAISPGPFPNEVVQKNEQFIKELCKKNPMGRIGHPKDLAGIIVYLSSDASGYTNGQNIMVDGGWTAW